MPRPNSETLEEFNFLYSYMDNKPSAIRQGAWKLHVRIGSQTENDYGFTCITGNPIIVSGGA